MYARRKYNSWRIFNAFYISFSSYLQKISVADNLIHLMRDEALCGLNNLLELILKRCELRQMPPLHPVKNTLQLLNVHDNNISKISRDYFDGCTALTYLTLSKNKLSSFPDVSPARQTLNLLKISSNGIRAISRTMIDSTFPYLEEVYVFENEIKVMPCGTNGRHLRRQNFFPIAIHL